jgi:hypothetical protein
MSHSGTVRRQGMRPSCISLLQSGKPMSRKIGEPIAFESSSTERRHADRARAWYVAIEVRRDHGWYQGSRSRGRDDDIRSADRCAIPSQLGAIGERGDKCFVLLGNDPTKPVYAYQAPTANCRVSSSWISAAAPVAVSPAPSLSQRLPGLSWPTAAPRPMRRTQAGRPLTATALQLASAVIP